MSIISPFQKPLYIMTKPAGSSCNLACDYCYYLEKANLYPSQKQVMDDALLEKFIKEYIEAQPSQYVLFTWHGGEPLLQKLDFYRKVIRLQKKYSLGKHIENSLQTNGTLITDEHCNFFKDNEWLIGVSIDGPKHIHDSYRRTRGGAPSFDRVMKGIERMNRIGVEWNAMAVVNNLNVVDPIGFYQFFKSIDCKYLQFTPIVERVVPHYDGRSLASLLDSAGKITPFSVEPMAWGDFLCSVFDQWYSQDVGNVYVQIFESALANWVGVTPGLCTMAKNCGHAGVMEFNGDVYSCDHFVFPEYKLGNIHHNGLIEMMFSQKQLDFGKAKSASLPSQCKNCQWLFVCNGECPKNRFMTTADGEKGLNYLCAGYKKFYKYAEIRLGLLADSIRENNPDIGKI